MDQIQVKKLLPVIITSLVWDINFRLTFKNIDAHMDLGSYPSLKTDPLVILIKNVSGSIIYLSIYFISKKIISSEKGPKKLFKIKTEGRRLIYTYEKEKNSFLGSLITYHNLNTKIKQILFCVKIFFLILFIYIAEEIYFMTANIHIIDRLNVPKRNLSVLIVIFIFSSILITKQFKFQKHQLFTSLIVICTSLFIIIFEATTVTRFKKIYNIKNFSYEMIVYILMGLEIVLIKYLTDIMFINPFLILFSKGILGTIFFIFINIYLNGDKLFYFIDKIFYFEYDNLYQHFIVAQKIFYLITILILQCLKIFIINKYSETYFLAVAMISDVFFFPLYFIEKFGVQQFKITTSSTFYLNLFFGVLNPILLLIFNEIIELKFCGIEKDLNKNIKERETIEMNSTKNNFEKDDDLENTDYYIDFDNSEKNLNESNIN